MAIHTSSCSGILSLGQMIVYFVLVLCLWYVSGPCNCLNESCLFYPVKNQQ